MKSFYQYSWCSRTGFSYVEIILSVLLSMTRAENASAQSRAASVSPLPWNPASSVFLQRNSASFSGTPISSNDVKIRYVGSETITKKAESPLNFSDFQTGVAFKPNRRLSLGIGELLPPISLKRKIDGIPIVVLNSVNPVDLDINASVKYGISLFGGYLINENLSAGAGFSSRQIVINAVANTTSKERLLDGQFKLTNTSLKVGLNFSSPTKRFRIGVASSIFASNAISTSIETPIVAGPETDALNNTSVNSNLIFGDLLIGIEYIANRQTTVFADLWWRRADKNQKEFSLVDLQEKPKDIYDTVSVFVGGKFRVQEKQFAISEFTYEPSPVGAGSPGPDGKSGFGMRETALLYSGFGDLVPAWSISLGLQYGGGIPTIADINPSKPNKLLRRSKNRRKNSDRAKTLTFWERTTVSVSFRYKRASLGIDTQGELPGAYSQNRIQFPVSLITSF
jgi:hypothetical protein